MSVSSLGRKTCLRCKVQIVTSPYRTKDVDAQVMHCPMCGNFFGYLQYAVTVKGKV